MAFIVFAFLLWRLADFFIAYIAKVFDFYQEHFDYIFQLYHSNPHIPNFLISFANYDGALYLHIAHDGYKQYQQAFFPLFPLLIHVCNWFFGGSYLLTGLFIANVSFFLGVWLFVKYLALLGKSQSTIMWTLLYLLLFPTTFFFGAVYTEGLCFLLIAATLYCSQRKRMKTMIVLSVLAALTRLVGTFLYLPLFCTLVLEQTGFRLSGTTWESKVCSLLLSLKKHYKRVALSFTPVGGLLGYMLYLWITTRDSFLFYHLQSGFHAERTSSRLVLLPKVYYRYMHIFLKAPHTFTYFIAIIEFLIFNLFLYVLLKNLWYLWVKKKSKGRLSLIGLNLFSLTNLLLPTLTGTLTSLPRYALLSISFFLCLAEIKRVWIRIGFLIVFSVLHILLLTLFIQGYFVG